MIGRRSKRVIYGRGLGGFLSKMFNLIKPKIFGLAKSAVKSNSFKKIVKDAKDVALNTSSKVIQDVVSGKNVRETVKSNVKEGAKQIASNAAKTSLDSLHSIINNKKDQIDDVKNIKTPKKRSKKRKVLGSKKVKKDIFET